MKKKYYFYQNNQPVLLLPSCESEDQKWYSELRPGGWFIGTSETGKRIRYRFIKNKENKKNSERFFFQTLSTQVNGFSQDDSPTSSVETTDILSLEAPFPGILKKNHVTIGQIVEKGKLLLVLESMKMDFFISAPFLGKVQNIFFSPPQQVSTGTVLLELKQIKKELSTEHREEHY